MIINYNMTQLMAAAEFIWNNNPAVQQWPARPRSVMDVVNDILRTAKRQAEKNVQGWIRDGSWSTFVGTGGYTVMLTSDSDFDDMDNIVVDLDILVDPAVGCRSYNFVTQEIHDEDE